MGNLCCNSGCCGKRTKSGNVSDAGKLKRGESVFDQHPWLRKLRTFVITVCLVAILFGYSFIGAMVFVVLEQGNEVAAFARYQTRREQFIDDLANLTASIESTTEVPNFNSSQFDNNTQRANIDRILKEYESTMEEFICKERVSIGGDPTKPKWNFFGALFFSATVITTIGYGNIAPVTVGGRVFCMVYAVFGIALLLLVLASIGTLLARGATIAYRHLHAWIKKRRGKDRTDTVTYKPDRQSREIKDEIYRQSETRSSDGEVHVVDIQGDGKGGDRRSNSVDDAPAKKRDSELTEGDDDEDGSEENETEEVQIPLTFVLVFAFLYICFLALLLYAWEGDQWDYFEAFYFSFITLTTIGFGDLVPLHQKNLLACTFFILLGMAIMSMCIALAQEMIIQKVAWLSKKIGVACASRKERAREAKES